ncbi:3'-5' exonuclease [Roseobacter sp.]|uniref:3'-5' exonuclease n=1 Tax=Roseobacter sp. TaxID=1907202 RepID=UPI0025DE91D7|nr:3'-5' exonuclease [Roseobacter sp.]
MRQAGLRLRVFLFFALLAAAGVVTAWGGLWLGYRQLAQPAALPGFVTAAVVCGFGLPLLSAGIWLLFDENVSKPVETLSGALRVGTDAGGAALKKHNAGQYLGDLAPAVASACERFANASAETATRIDEETARLKKQREQLLQILSDVPVAVILAGPDHQIVLYDGQAADLMARERPALLNGSVFDYLDEDGVRAALERLAGTGANRTDVTLTGRSGAVYTGHIRRFGRTGGYTLMLKPLSPDAARPLVYDFDLLGKSRCDTLADTPLRDLAWVVFDSETTGLDPQKDEVVQLAAVRIINGRIVAGEVFDALVNPGRPIPAASTKVHGVSEEMVRAAPPFPDVCRSFHGFCAEAVIIAHNAPFDVAFLKRAEPSSGCVFDHPVLDTVHLSAIVFGGAEEHTLDALCYRLNITIAPELRHTALGDAEATARAFCALLPVLEARGLNTFGALSAECERHRRILKTVIS